MGTHARVAAGLSIAVLGTIHALLFGGGTVGGCLGPLGVTAIQCAAHGGRLPTTGALLPMIVVAWAAGALVPLRTGWAMRDGIAAAGGALCGAIGHLVTRPSRIEGPDLDGTPLSLQLPVEPWGLVAWAAAGGLVALCAVGVLRALRSRFAR